MILNHNCCIKFVPLVIFSKSDADVIQAGFLTRAGGRVEVVASLSQGRTAAAQCGLFTHISVPVIFEPPCMCDRASYMKMTRGTNLMQQL